MGRGGSCCDGEENEDEVDYDPANKGKLKFRKMKNMMIISSFRSQ